MSGFSFSFSFGSSNNSNSDGRRRFNYSFGSNRRSNDNANVFDSHLRSIFENMQRGGGGGGQSGHHVRNIFQELFDTARFNIHPPGADVQKLKKRKIDENDEGKQCAICLCEFDECGKEVVQLPCDHIFHEDCIKPWLKNHRTCPTCRKDVTESPTSSSSSSSSSNSSHQNLDDDGFSMSDIMEAIRLSNQVTQQNQVEEEETPSTKMEEDDDVSAEEKRQIERAIQLSLQEEQQQNQQSSSRSNSSSNSESILDTTFNAFSSLLGNVFQVYPENNVSSTSAPMIIEEEEEEEEVLYGDVENEEEEEVLYGDEEVMKTEEEEKDDDDVPPGTLAEPSYSDTSIVLRVFLPSGKTKTQTFTQNTSLIDLVRLSLNTDYRDDVRYEVWNKFPRHAFRDLSKKLGDLNISDLSQVAISRHGEEPHFLTRRS